MSHGPRRKHDPCEPVATSLGEDFDAWWSLQKKRQKNSSDGATGEVGFSKPVRKTNNASGDIETDVKMPPREFATLGSHGADDAQHGYTLPEEGVFKTMHRSPSPLGRNRLDKPSDPRKPWFENAADDNGILEKANFDSFSRNTLHHQDVLFHHLHLQQQQQQQLSQMCHVPTSLALLDTVRGQRRQGSALLQKSANAVLPPVTSWDPLFYPAQQISAASRLSLARLALLEQLALSSQEHQHVVAAAIAGLNGPPIPSFPADRGDPPCTQWQQRIPLPPLAAFGGRAFSSAVADGSGSTVPTNTNEFYFASNGGSVQEMSIRTPSLQASKKRRNKKDKCKPKRPLSAYNFFFQEERSKLLNEIANSTGNTEDRITRSLSVPPGVPAAVKRKRRRDRGEPHGIIAFEKLAKIIGARWRNVTGERLAAYQMQAETDLQRYKEEMDAYHKKNRTRAQLKDLDDMSDNSESITEYIGIKKEPPS